MIHKQVILKYLKVPFFSKKMPWNCVVYRAVFLGGWWWFKFYSRCRSRVCLLFLPTHSSQKGSFQNHHTKQTVLGWSFVSFSNKHLCSSHCDWWSVAPGARGQESSEDSQAAWWEVRFGDDTNARASGLLRVPATWCVFILTCSVWIHDSQQTLPAVHVRKTRLMGNGFQLNCPWLSLWSDAQFLTMGPCFHLLYHTVKIVPYSQ